MWRKSFFFYSELSTLRLIFLKMFPYMTCSMVGILCWIRYVMTLLDYYFLVWKMSTHTYLIRAFSTLRFKPRFKWLFRRPVLMSRPVIWVIIKIDTVILNPPRSSIVSEYILNSKMYSENLILRSNHKRHSDKPSFSKNMTVSTYLLTSFLVPASLKDFWMAFSFLSNHTGLKWKRVIFQIFSSWSRFEMMGWGLLSRISVYIWVRRQTCAKNSHLK